MTEDTTFCDVDDGFDLDVDDIEESTVEGGQGLGGGSHGSMFVTSAFNDDSSSDDDSLHGLDASLSYNDEKNNVFHRDNVDDEVYPSAFDPRRLFIPPSPLNRGVSSTSRSSSAFTKSSSSSSSSSTTPHGSSSSHTPTGFPIPANYGSTGSNGGYGNENSTYSHNKYQVQASTVSPPPSSFPSSSSVFVSQYLPSI